MATAKHRRGITLHRAADAPDITATDMMSAQAMSPDAREGWGQVNRAGSAEGAVVKVLVRDAGGFSLIHVWLKANYPLPRHSHDSACMYYVISGSAIMGSQVLRAGDAFFARADALYQYTAGPDGVEVLEVRHGSERFDMKIPDASPERWAAMAETVAANRDRWARERVSPTFVANAG